MLHGMRVTSTMWDPLRAALPGRVTRAPDLPGHGTALEPTFTVESATRCAAEAVERVGGRAVLVGHSLGGFIAIATAARHPEAVAGVVAIGCSSSPRGLGLLAYRGYGALLARDPDRAGRVSDRGFRSQLPSAEYRALAAGGFSCDVAPAVVAQLGRADPVAELASYPGPVWLLNGSLDQFRRDEQAFLDACQDGRLTVWPRLTHVSILGRTARLARFVEDACIVVEHDLRPG